MSYKDGEILSVYGFLKIPSTALYHQTFSLLRSEKVFFLALFFPRENLTKYSEPSILLTESSIQKFFHSELTLLKHQKPLFALLNQEVLLLYMLKILKKILSWRNFFLQEKILR